MSEFLRCILRNASMGAAVAASCYIMYSPMLLDNPTAFSIALLGTTCTLTFAVGAIIWRNDHDNKLFQYYLGAARIFTGFSAPCVFLGLFLFHWWGLGAGFIAGMLISYTCLSLFGDEKPSNQIAPLTPSLASDHRSAREATSSSARQEHRDNSSIVIFSASSSSILNSDSTVLDAEGTRKRADSHSN